MVMRKRLVGGDPRKHTAIIGDVETMWQKLVWAIRQFDSKRGQWVPYFENCTS